LLLILMLELQRLAAGRLLHSQSLPLQDGSKRVAGMA
jgi:hypothetical protein